VNNAVTSDMHAVLLPSLCVSSLNINTDRPTSFKAARHRSRYLCRLQLENKAATFTYVNPHIAGAINI